MERVDADGEPAGVDPDAAGVALLQARPGWWPSGSAWPWVGPDLTPKVGSLPAQARSAAFNYYTRADELHAELRQLLLQRRSPTQSLMLWSLEGLRRHACVGSDLIRKATGEPGR